MGKMPDHNVYPRQIDRKTGLISLQPNSEMLYLRRRGRAVQPSYSAHHANPRQLRQNAPPTPLLSPRQKRGLFSSRLRNCFHVIFLRKETQTMVRPVVIFPDDRLTSVCKYVNRFDKELVDLVHDLFETMYDSDGVGLAAPQIGVLRRVFVMDVREEDEPFNPVAFINPVLLVKTGAEVDQEGCLSLPGVFLDVRRATYVVCAGQALDGTHFEHAYRGLEARVIQHELDHLSGVLFTTRAESSEKMAAAR